jgi:hypothetical protein
VLHAGDVERRPPSALVVLRQLHVVALPVHPGGDVPDPGPGGEPRVEQAEFAGVRVEKGKAERGGEYAAALGL